MFSIRRLRPARLQAQRGHAAPGLTRDQRIYATALHEAVTYAGWCKQMSAAEVEGLTDRWARLIRDGVS